MKILLGSNSPRRKELLQSLGFDFDTVVISCEEVYPDNLPVNDIAAYLSQLKSSNYILHDTEDVLITADTIVILKNEVLGKPKNAADAQRMLSALSDTSHEVRTAITVRSLHKSVTYTDVAEVEFAKITPEEIQFYISNFRPFDKAGSYGIQEWLGMAKIKKITGSYFTIMGLPTHLIYEILKGFS